MMAAMDNIVTKTKTLPLPGGRVITVEFQSLTVPVTLGGATREIEITRSTPSHPWSYAGPVLVQVGRGTKVHTTRRATVFHKADRFEFGYTVICNRSARVFAWADGVNQGNSGWTNNTVS